MTKPRVYELASREADANLDRKIRILAELVAHGLPWVLNDDGAPARDAETGWRVLDFVPENETQFAKWSCDIKNSRCILNCDAVRKDLINRFGFFRSHGADSLKKRKVDRERADVLFKAIGIAAKNQLSAEDPRTKIEELEAKIKQQDTAMESMAALVQKAFVERTEYLKQIEALKRSFRAAKRIYATYEAEAQAEMQKKDDQIAELRRESSENLRLVKK